MKMPANTCTWRLTTCVVALGWMAEVRTRITDVIAALEVDVIGLQELT